jgi:hypothetical protein
LNFLAALLVRDSLMHRARIGMPSSIRCARHEEHISLARGGYQFPHINIVRHAQPHEQSPDWR